MLSSKNAPTVKDKLDMTSDDRLFAQELLGKEKVNIVVIAFNQILDTISKVEIKI